MFRFIFLFFFITSTGFSQKVQRLEFSVSEIDSLSKQQTCLSIFDHGGKIHSEKEYLEEKKKTIGSGYHSWKIHAFFTDSLHYKTLSNTEKRHYDDRKTCRLIRADHITVIDYEDGSSENEKVLFYFSNDELFYIKYEKNQISDAKSKETVYHYFLISDIHNRLAGNKPLEEYLIGLKNDIMEVWLER